MFFYHQPFSYSPIKLPQNSIFIKETPLTSQIIHKISHEKSSTYQQKIHRKSMTSYQGVFEETLDKRNRSFVKLEKTIQNVLDQNKRTKLLIKEFLTPYKERKNQKDFTKEEEILKENTAQFPEEKELSFNTAHKATEKEDILAFMDNLEDYPEEKPEFSIKFQNYVVNKFKNFQPEKYECFEKNEEKNILEEIQFIEIKSGINLQNFIADLYKELKNDKTEAEVFKERTNQILNEENMITECKTPIQIKTKVTFSDFVKKHKEASIFD